MKVLIQKYYRPVENHCRKDSGFPAADYSRGKSFGPGGEERRILAGGEGAFETIEKN